MGLEGIMFGFFWRIRNSERYIKYLLERRKELMNGKVTLVIENRKLKWQISDLKRKLRINDLKHELLNK